MQLRNVYNYVINLTHFKPSADLCDLKKKRKKNTDGERIIKLFLKRMSDNILSCLQRMKRLKQRARLGPTKAAFVHKRCLCKNALPKHKPQGPTCFLNVISVNNWNHLSDPDATSSVSTPDDRAVAPPTLEVASFVSHGVLSPAQSASCFLHTVHPPPSSSPAVVVSFQQTPSDLAGITQSSCVSFGFLYLMWHHVWVILW